MERSSGGLGRAASGGVPVTPVRPIFVRTSQPYGLYFSDRHFSNFFRDRTSEKSDVKSDNKVRKAASSGWRTAALGLLPSGGGQQPPLLFYFLVELRQFFSSSPATTQFFSALFFPECPIFCNFPRLGRRNLRETRVAT